MFSLTRSNFLRQLPDLNGIIRQLRTYQNWQTSEREVLKLLLKRGSQVTQSEHIYCRYKHLEIGNRLFDIGHWIRVSGSKRAWSFHGWG